MVKKKKEKLTLGQMWQNDFRSSKFRSNFSMKNAKDIWSIMHAHAWKGGGTGLLDKVAQPDSAARFSDAFFHDSPLGGALEGSETVGQFLTVDD